MELTQIVNKLVGQIVATENFQFANHEGNKKL